MAPQFRRTGPKAGVGEEGPTPMMSGWVQDIRCLGQNNRGSEPGEAEDLRSLESRGLNPAACEPLVPQRAHVPLDGAAWAAAGIFVSGAFR